MPQLEFATFASQIFWLAVSFGILYLIMARSALPVVREVLHNRQSRISDDLKKAEALKTEAEQAEADFTSVITTARLKASETLAAAREKADKEAEKRNAKLDETFQRQAKEAEHRVDVIRKEAIEKMAPIAADTAADIVKKLVGLNIDHKKIEQLLADSGIKQ